MAAQKPAKNAKNQAPAEEAEETRLVPFHHLIPNLITITAIAAGLTAIQYAINDQWERAIVAVLIALVLDGLDGATARLLDAASDFGAQLDNLSDFLAFGVAPSIILYMWILQDSGKVGWMAMIFFTSATALRLARYNIEQKNKPKWHIRFFSGIPSPAGAALALLPVIIWLQDERFFSQFEYASPLVGLWAFAVGLLMVSRIPTFSLKALKVPAGKTMPLMAAVALVLAALVHMPWLTLTIIIVGYLGTIPFSIRKFHRMKNTNN